MELTNKNIKLELIAIEWEDVNPKIIEFILKLMEERKISGKTYIGIAKSLGELPIPYSDDEIVDGIIYSVRNLNMAKGFLENYRKNYNMGSNIHFDNAITVTIEKSKDFEINTILFNAKNDYFMIRLGYPKTKEDMLNYNQMTKKLKKK